MSNVCTVKISKIDGYEIIRCSRMEGSVITQRLIMSILFGFCVHVRKYRFYRERLS